MAAKSFRELENLSPDELDVRLKELREELFTLRFRNSMRQLDNALIAWAAEETELDIVKDAHTDY